MPFTRSRLICSCGVVAASASAAVCAWLFWKSHEPVYAGKTLSAWADELCKLDRLSNIVSTARPQVRAMRAIGTNAIPWLTDELIRPAPLAWRINQLLDKQSVIKYRLPTTAPFPYWHQLRARAGFWALGEIAEPAIPKLASLLEREPEFAPSALAGIGARALPALEKCLTNTRPYHASSGPQAKLPGSPIGGLYVAIDLGRISRSEAAYLLPTIRVWYEQNTNRDAAYWARGVLERMNAQN